MKQPDATKKHRIYTMSFARVYPEYINKAQRKGRTKSEVDEIILWLTGYTQSEFEKQLENQTDMETFYKVAPKMNPKRKEIKGVICGIRVEEIKDKTMQNIRYLDKLIDELAQGKPMEKILRGDAFHNIGAPASRALESIGVKTLSELTKYSEKELLALHGFGPKALKLLKEKLNEKGLSLALS